MICWPPIIALVGPRRGRVALPASADVVEERHTDVQSTLLVSYSGPILDPSWSVEPVSLETLVLAYMGRDARRAQTSPPLRVMP